MKKLGISLSVYGIFFIIALLNNESSAQDIIIDYLGQAPPADTAVIFAPGIVSLPNRVENNIAFSPDGKECYISAFNNQIGKIYWLRYINNAWTEQEVPFPGNHNVFMSWLSADGNKLYFGKDDDIWMVERTDGKWGEQQHLSPPVNSTSYEGRYSETTDGIVYLRSNRTGSILNRGDIWCIHPSSGEAESLGPLVNSGTYICDPCIAPDGSYLIFSSIRPGLYGEQDLFISLKKENNEWAQPINMEESGANINIAQHSQNSPSLSPDGKYLFFRRHNYQGEKHDIYWVSTSVIDRLRKKHQLQNE